MGVAHGESIIPILNRCIDLFHQQGLPIFATRDWAPHRSLLVPDSGRTLATALHRGDGGRATALDDRGLEAIVLVDAVRAIDAQRSDGERTRAELRGRGVELRCAAEICGAVPGA